MIAIKTDSLQDLKQRSTGGPSLADLMTRERWIEVGRIVLTGLIAILYWQELVPLQVLWVAVAIGLYPLVKTGILDFTRFSACAWNVFLVSPTR